MKAKRVRLSALFLSVIMACSLTGCTEKEQEQIPDETENESVTVQAETEHKTETEADTEPPAETEEPVTEHSSPTELMTVRSGVQMDFTDVVLNHETNKNYPIDLDNFIISGDTVQKFVFEFEADSNIGTYQGGCGIAVDANCAAATNEYWYQSQDFSVAANGKYVKIEWNVPAEIQEYINPTGTVQIGYWWGDAAEVRLKYVTCCYTRTAEIPVDETTDLKIGKTLNYQTDSSLQIPLADMLKDNYVPQAVTFHLHADSGFGKLNAGLGIKTFDDWYASGTVSEITDNNQLSLTWLIPETVKADVPQDTEIKLDYFWSECENITLDSITVKSSYFSPENIYIHKENDDEHIQQNESAQKIAEEIKVGWNLGNALDCYDITWAVSDHETAWGNPKTTRKMIDTVRDAGFNAIRIPVSWTDHIDEEGNIDSAWLDRVQQVVDYAIDNDLYTIINMHHDDYTWLTPLYAEEKQVTEKYTHIWSQIAEHFKDYDTKLLFEGMNEPRTIGTETEWTGGTPEERDVINHLLQAFVDTVRASGGKNDQRTLIITTHAASVSEEALNGLVIPDDDNLILSLHYYAPWKFTSYEFEEDKTFNQAAKDELSRQFDILYRRFVARGIPVIIGEFGAENKNNPAERAAYYEYYLTAAAERGIPCFIWDNNTLDGEGSYGLLGRESCKWYYPGIIEAIQNAVQ